MITKFIEELKKLNVEYCLNEQVYDYKKLKYIIVGDNPGKTEKKENRFFIGASGQKLRKHFESNKLVDDFNNECIIFNKTFIHTVKTEQLESIRINIGIELFDNIQIHCAKEISKITNEFNIPILIFGKSKIGANLLFESFWKAINEFTIIKENILVFNHPSYNHFFNEWDKYKTDLKLNSKELLKEIGTINSQKIQLSNTKKQLKH
ncbi:uracil-DNA glycosylase family protein [Flavobacterium sp. WC2509]|uniref:uracil-DNA glycosylase family protein n=1 Tax=Flavobacterium sp. WC2509 TaxID=3461406 RepID=UPI0040444317